MSEDNDLMALLVASVMTRVTGLDRSGQQMVEALHTKMMAGDVTAKHTLHNPWNSSVPASRRMPAIETRLEELGTQLEEAGPNFLALLLEMQRLEKQRLHQHDREQQSLRGTFDMQSGSLEAGFGRIVRVLQAEGVSNRHGSRVSVATLARAARLILHQTEDRWCDEVVSVRELLQANVLQRVCVLHGWRLGTGEVHDFDGLGVLWAKDSAHGTWHTEVAHDPNFDSSWYCTTLPVPAIIDPPGIPQNWTPESMVEMHPVIWDAFPPDKYYRSFVRELEDGENLAFNWTDRWSGDPEPMPRHATLEAMIRWDDRFASDYRRAEMRSRVLDGYRAELEDVTLEELAQSPSEKASELLDFAFPVASAVIFDVDKWDAWRPWGILLKTLKVYLESHPDDQGARGSLVFAWAYLLKGRLAQSDDDLPAFVRAALFDWMLLPVTSTLTPAVRILIPRDRLMTDGGRRLGEADDD